MADFILYIFALFTVLYAALLVLLFFVWHRVSLFEGLDFDGKELTIVIPFRNEAHNLPQLLESIKKQTAEGFKVILVDDFSEDGSYQLAKRLIEDIGFETRLLSMKDYKGPLRYKKGAIDHAIAHVTSTYVLATDADCELPPNWVASYAAYFARNPSIQLVSAPVTLSHLGTSKITDIVQTIEFASLLGTGACTINIGKPTMANAANLGYAKNAYLAVGGFTSSSDTPSGDDEFLTHGIAKQFANGVAYLKSKQAIVRTDTLKTLRQFVDQRKRWASKWPLYRDFFPQLLALFIAGYHLVFLVTAFSSLLYAVVWPYFLVGLMVRMLLEILFVGSILHFVGEKKLIKWVWLLVPFYSLYVVFFAITGTMGKFSWKGRKFEV